MLEILIFVVPSLKLYGSTPLLRHVSLCCLVYIGGVRLAVLIATSPCVVYILYLGE
jgi:hypothetical protein